MKSIKENHPLDIATQLTRKGDHYLGHTSDHYANMVGPFGGITAATMLNAVLQHTEHIGDPVSLTINYAAPISDGSFEIKATPARTNRATQHWFIELFQDDAIVITGTAVFAKEERLGLQQSENSLLCPILKRHIQFLQKGCHLGYNNMTLKLFKDCHQHFHIMCKPKYPHLRRYNGFMMSLNATSISYR